MTASIHSLVFGTPSRAHAEQLVVMAGQAFAFDPTQWLNSLGDDGFDNMRTLTNEQGVVAGLVIHAVGQWFGGQRLASHVVTALVAAAHVRRQHVGHALITHTLREARNNDIPLSVLFASTPTFYRQVGYEPAGASLFFRSPTHCLPTNTEGAEFTPVTPAEHAPIRELYRAFASQRSGMIDRNEHFWRMQLDPYDGSRRYAYRIAFAGTLEGYVCFQHARPNNTLFVQEALGMTPRAARAALALISHHKSVAESVVFPDGPQGPLHKLISGNQARPEPGCQQWLLRIVNVAMALEQRGYPALDLTLELDVSDGTLPENAGRYVLELASGEAQVTRGGSGRIKLDVRALAAVFSGFSHPSEMQAAGLLSADASDVARLGAVFAGPSPYLQDQF